MPMAIEERPRGSLPEEGSTDGRETDGSIITDHPFEPRAEWWSLCRECGLAESAHAETSLHGIGYADD